MLLGASGVGKSDLALRLIDEGARLVADDRTILFGKHEALHARAPASIKGLLEIRGVGIVELPVRASVKIALAVRLGKEGARLPRPSLDGIDTAAVRAALGSDKKNEDGQPKFVLLPEVGRPLFGCAVDAAAVERELARLLREGGAS